MGSLGFFYKYIAYINYFLTTLLLLFSLIQNKSFWIRYVNILYILILSEPFFLPVFLWIRTEVFRFYVQIYCMLQFFLNHSSILLFFRSKQEILDLPYKSIVCINSYTCLVWPEIEAFESLVQIYCTLQFFFNHSPISFFWIRIEISRSLVEVHYIYQFL